MAKIDLNNFRLVKSGNPDHDLNYINDILHAIVARLGDSVGVLEAIKSISSDATIRISGDKDRPRLSALPAVAQANAYTDEAIANIPDSGINSVGASSPLVSSGGDDPVISMLPSGVSAGSVYFPSSITLDEWGRVVGITEGTAPVATSWGTIVGDLSDQTDISTALSGKIDVSEKGASFGVATLDSSGKLPPEQVPPLAITEPFVVSSEAEQLALVVQTGDVAVRNDLSKTFINATGNNNSMSDWVEMLSPPNAVVSVNGKTGAVVINKADVGLGNVDNTSDADKPISNATQNALNGKLSSITGTDSIVVSGSGTTRNISHATSGVTAGTYTYPVSIVVNDQGHVVTAVSGSAPITSISGTSPISVDGIGSNRTVSHTNSGVTAGTYTNATFTVDARGHITSASSGTGGSAVWGSITGNIANQTDLQNALNGKGGLATANEWTQVQTMHAPIAMGSASIPSNAHQSAYGFSGLRVGVWGVSSGNSFDDSAGLTYNLYPSGFLSFSHYVAGIGSVLRVSSSGLQFLTASSGTAGATATLTTRFQISPAGEVTMDATTAGSMRTAIGAVAATGTASQVINGNGTMRNITISSSAPTGGNDGDIHFRI